jgi:S-formylglutathione hydrolase FrmB
MRWIALATGAAVLLAGAYAGLRAVERRLERAHGHYTDARGATVLRYTLHSPRLGRELDEVGVVPAGGGTRPLLVFLHGRGMASDALLSDRLFRDLAALGPRAPEIVFVDGGDHSYYHDRRDGPWGSYVLREAIPDAIRRLHADPRRVAIGGISMGGFGALDLARLDPARFCAVGGHSAALWDSGGETPAGAFDDDAEFARHDVIAAARAGARFGRGRIWLDVGAADPFRAADAELASLLHATLHVWPGGHDVAYWNAHLARYLRFYADALAGCR